MKMFGLTILFFFASTLVATGQPAGQEKDRTKSQVPGQEKFDKKEPVKNQGEGPPPDQKTGKAPGQLAGQEYQCDCTIFPYEPDPPCPIQCPTRIVLTTATKDELILIVGLNESVAQRIVSWKDGQRPNSVEAYSKVLTSEQTNLLRTKLQELTKPQINYFRLPLAERTDQIKMIRAILNPDILAATVGSP